MNNYIQSFYPALPGSEIGNMTAFSSAVSPQFVTPTLVANNDNRKKLIEQRSKKNTEEKGPNFLQNVFDFLGSKDQQKFDASGKVIPTNKYQANPLSEYLQITNVDDNLNKPTLGKDFQSIFTPGYYKSEEQIEYDESRGKSKVAEKREQIEKDTEEEKYAKRMEEYTNQNLRLLERIGDMSQEARDRNMLRAGIMDLAGSPLIGGQAALEAAKNVGALTLGNMGAMAAQNRVLEANPVKNRFAGRYFR